MSALQISLIILALVVVGGLALHNWLQERKYRKQWTTTFGRPAINMGAGRDPVDNALEGMGLEAGSLERDAHEPADDMYISTPVVVSTPALYTHTADTRRTVIPDLTPTSSDPAPSVNVQQRNEDLPPAPIDPLLEFGIMLHTLDPMPSTLFTHLIENQRIASKATRWVGYSTQQYKWLDISPWRQQEFTDVLVAIQLTDRQGAVNEMDLRTVCDEVQQIAARYHGVASWEELAPVSIKAAKLDRFCVEVDVLIGLNVVSTNGPVFSGATIAQAALQAGLQLDATGVYHRLNDKNEVLYTMCNHEDVPFVADQMASLSTHGVTLLFEVPRIAQGVKVFADMAHFGQTLAEQLGGKLVDDNIRPLSSTGLQKIQAQLVHIYQQMEAGQIPAGSKRAMRLFN